MLAIGVNFLKYVAKHSLLSAPYGVREKGQKVGIKRKKELWISNDTQW